MEIAEKLVKFKLHIFSVCAFSLIILCLCYLAPSFVDILNYFWPLLLSTALFLLAIVVFGRIAPPDTEAYGEKAGEVMLGYVADQVNEDYKLM